MRHRATYGRVGGASRDRTDDLLLAKQALSQLSYGPAFLSNKYVRRRVRQLVHPASGRRQILQVVGLGGFEPPASPLSGVRSDQLSYRPGYAMKQARVRARVGHQPVSGSPDDESSDERSR
jgi:hypothetical protein